MRVNEQGRSMIEMLGVLAIVGVLSVGGIAGYSKAMNKFKTNKKIKSGPNFDKKCRNQVHFFIRFRTMMAKCPQKVNLRA